MSAYSPRELYEKLATILPEELVNQIEEDRIGEYEALKEKFCNGDYSNPHYYAIMHSTSLLMEHIDNVLDDEVILEDKELFLISETIRTLAFGLYQTLGNKILS